MKTIFRVSWTSQPPLFVCEIRGASFLTYTSDPKEAVMFDPSTALDWKPMLESLGNCQLTAVPFDDAVRLAEQAAEQLPTYQAGVDRDSLVNELANMVDSAIRGSLYADYSEWELALEQILVNRDVTTS